MTAKPKVVVASMEGRVWRGPDGQWFCRAPHAHENYWKGVLDRGCQVTLIARRTDDQPSGAALISPRIKVHPIDDFGLGASGLRLIPRTMLGLLTLLRTASCAYIRMPGVVGPIVAFVAVLMHVRIVSHLVGNPIEAAPSAQRPWLSRLVRGYFRASTRAVIHAAMTAFYVDPALASLYPPRRIGADPWARASRKRNVEVEAIQWADRPRLTRPSARLIISAVGSQEQPYKGHDLLIEAVAILVENGHDIELRLIGDGRLQQDLRSLARQRGLDGRVQFLGHLPGAGAVQDQIRTCDIFVLPSRTEGFPRVLVEAMAAGVPCLATDVGAVSTVMPADLLIPTAEIASITTAIGRLAASPALMSRAAEDCLSSATNFREEQLAENERFSLVLAHGELRP